MTQYRSLRALFFVTSLLSVILLNAQAKSVNAGIYLKAGMVVRGIGFGANQLDFGTESFEVRPGGGFKLFFGTGFGTKIMDFELTAEESVSLAFATITGSNGSQPVFMSFFTTNLYATALFKIPTKRDNVFRLGGGPMITFPGKMKFKLDGESQGYASFGSGIGSHFVADLMISAKSVFIVPGIRLNFSRLESKEATLEDQSNINAVETIDIGSFNLYLMVRF